MIKISELRPNANHTAAVTLALGKEEADLLLKDNQIRIRLVRCKMEKRIEVKNAPGAGHMTIRLRTVKVQTGEASASNAAKRSTPQRNVRRKTPAQCARSGDIKQAAGNARLSDEPYPTLGKLIDKPLEAAWIQIKITRWLYCRVKPKCRNCTVGQFLDRHIDGYLTSNRIIWLSSHVVFTY
ncbi:hypothetical protein NQ314_012450 [Rhamnusium bicolor]|uniref:Uncharacterized protein n=1 Tax=Rhamnusium bicolor TaxID=1586634 RepID=A0AAV8XCU9_9CUCU|nr:hypothetical protein NQ314_012450 [Rhamnusium bicolor]